MNTLLANRTWRNKTAFVVGLIALILAAPSQTVPCGAEVPPEVPPEDTLELSLGCHLTGKVIKKQEGKIPSVVVQIDDELTVAIPQQRIRRVRMDEDLAEYKRVKELAGNDAEKHYQVAKWCTENKLTHQRRYHLQRAITFDPDHSKARAALHYVEQPGGIWILYSQQERGKGKVRTPRGWDYPEVVSKRKMREEAKVKANKFRSEVTRQVRAFVKAKPDRMPAILATIKGFTDPLAAGAIGEQLELTRNKKLSNREASLRPIWVELLGKHRTTESVRALVKTALEEPAPVIREAALSELQKYGSGSAIATSLPMLKSNSMLDVDRALRVLRFFPNREHAMAYIEALTTTHKREIAPSSNTNAAFSNTGGGGFSTGSKKVVITETIKHPDAIALLKDVEPGVDYGYNKQAWREHFAALLNHYSGNLRRDP